MYSYLQSDSDKEFCVGARWTILHCAKSAKMLDKLLNCNNIFNSYWKKNIKITNGNI